ncbi:MAG: hypothetical protein ACD_26C00122G0003 [uncultured bacterium]|nr:MAG: hypothetical protein ACD_26C00122G0003 [uncultured bacterium]
MKNKSKKELFFFASQAKGKKINFDFYTYNGKRVSSDVVKREVKGERTKFFAFL